MKTNHRPTIRAIAGVIVAIISAIAAPALAAENTGTITGRVLNPATGEYVRDAKIEIKETGQTASSEAGGEYRLLAVPAGKVTVAVTYTGYRTAPATVEVVTGGTATQDFQIVSTSAVAISGAEIVELDRFVVSSAREGNAKAIMDQRNAMNVTNMVASDAFGDNPEGNVAEFVRFLPGVTLDSNFGEGRYVNLRGLGSEYTAVTMDGIPMASTDASNTGGSANGRSFSFEQVAMSSMDSVEVSKTISADTDANAPAGTINLRSKRAFDRNSRRFSVMANAALHSSAFTLGKTNGPWHSGETHKIRPGGSLEYSDIFLNKRLGIVLSLSESNIYEETDTTTLAYNRTPTAADPRPQVVSSIAMLSAPRFYERSAATLTMDFRATPSLAFGVNIVYNTSELWTPQRTVTLTTGTRTAVTGDGLLNFTTVTGAAISDSGNNMVSKLSKSLLITPSVDWKSGNLAVDGRFSYSNAKSWYDNEDHGMFYNPGALAVTGVNFSAERSSLRSAAWHITQTSGKDISDPASFPSNTALTLDDGRSSRQKFYTFQLNAKLPTTFGLPMVWKAGFKSTYQSRTYDNIRTLTQYNYIGPASSYWADKPSDFIFNYSVAGATITSLSSGRIFMPDLADAYEDFQANPANYRQTLTAANVYAAWVTNHQRYAEEIDAAYLMGTAQLGNNASLRAGLRWERTTNIAKQPDAYGSNEVRAAGHTVSASTGQATTVDGTAYQFISRPWKERNTSFANFFPSASFKYRLPWNTDLSLGFGATIRRAPYSALSGVYLVNDEARTVTITNPRLQPESGRNFALRLAHYYEPLGMVAVSCYENQVKDMFLTNTISAQEFGNTDSALDGYLFTTTVNSTDSIKIRGMEIEVSQNLGFLGKHLGRFNITGSYTHNYAVSAQLTGMVPNIVNGGINFTYGRFNINCNGNWVDNTFTALGTTNTWTRHRLHANAGASVKLSRRLTLIVSARNVLSTPRITMQQPNASAPAMTIREDNGTTYTFSLKATY